MMPCVCGRVGVRIGAGVRIVFVVGVGVVGLGRFRGEAEAGE